MRDSYLRMYLSRSENVLQNYLIRWENCDPVCRAFCLFPALLPWASLSFTAILSVNWVNIGQSRLRKYLTCYPSRVCPPWRWRDTVWAEWGCARWAGSGQRCDRPSRGRHLRRSPSREQTPPSGAQCRVRTAAPWRSGGPCGSCSPDLSKSSRKPRLLLRVSRFSLKQRCSAWRGNVHLWKIIKFRGLRQFFYSGVTAGKNGENVGTS